MNCKDFECAMESKCINNGAHCKDVPCLQVSKFGICYFCLMNNVCIYSATRDKEVKSHAKHG